MSLRTKIILTLLSVVIIPFVVVFALLFAINSRVFPQPFLKSVDSLDWHASNVSKNFEKYIGDSHGIDRHVIPLMEDKFRRLIYADTENVVRYDSKKRLTGENLSTAQDDDSAINNLYSHSFDFPIFINGTQEGTLYLLPSTDFKAIFNLLIALPFILIAIFILTIVILTFFLSKLLAEGIIRPLRILNQAAEEISEGNLDFEMAYDGHDELKSLYQSFDHMRLKLKTSLNKQMRYETSRRQLIASISHDLKTPLSSIKGYVEALEDGMATDKQTYDRYLCILSEKTNQLNRLIDDLVLFSKRELIAFQVDARLVKANELLESIFSAWEWEQKDKAISFDVRRPFPELFLYVDPNRIEQILGNLVSNGLKFAKSTIMVYARHLENTLAIYVEDDGSGIPPEDRPYVFDHFYKSDKSRQSKSGGLGLGLAICKELAEAHGGSVHFQSRTGKGTVFKLLLPETKPSELENKVVSQTK